jgi:arylsulfatase A-like enzyme
MSEGRLTRRDFMRLAGSAAVGLAATPMISRLGWAEDRKPNIIFILADDLGWGDLGCYGHSQIKTPNLDGLAKQGTLFTNFYVGAPVCSPSRAAFLTGLCPSRTRILHALGNELPDWQKEAGMAEYLNPAFATTPRLLKSAGYKTAHIGKWHLGTNPQAPEVTAYGFDVAKPVLGKPDFLKGSSRRDADWRPHSTEKFVDEGIKFIEENRDKPFYLSLCLLDPHATLTPTPEQMKPYAGPQFNPGEDSGYKGAMAVYYSVVTNIDTQVGRLLARLDEMKLADDTIIIFSSDNGPEDIHVPNASHSGVGTAGPFRGRKRSLYDGGIRMPFIVRWPGQVPAGKVNDTSVLTAVDLLPTLSAMAGADASGAKNLDGENVGDILRGSNRQRSKPVMWDWRFTQSGDTINHSPQLAIRDGQWKLLMNRDGGRVELYDLAKNHIEVDNVASEHPDVVSRLSKRLLDWVKTLPPGKPMAGSGMDPYKWPK